jgi:hypothetical protein
MLVKALQNEVTGNRQSETQVELSGKNTRLKRKLKSGMKLKNLNESNGCWQRRETEITGKMSDEAKAEAERKKPKSKAKSRSLRQSHETESESQGAGKDWKQKIAGRNKNRR